MIVEHEYYGDDKQKLITVTNKYTKITKFH